MKGLWIVDILIFITVILTVIAFVLYARDVRNNNDTLKDQLLLCLCVMATVVLYTCM